ncbi:MAG: lysine--tRNA ligase [Verrucomicrobia bacterium]|nr:lysine--tRNA ligase [Verrucomicrobiota bacterium]MDE3098734.1 lysine--tRNA ligase [Verrucomicrobiota bacterium]
MASNPLIEIRDGRLAKAAALRSLGLNPYPSRGRRSHYAKPILDDFPRHEGKTVTVAGRLMSWRKQGALAFAHIQDQTGRLQLFLRRNLVRETDAADGRLGYAETNLLDIGDIIEAAGKVVKTERGEISVLVESLRLLAKAVRPLPDLWSGLKDREQVLRKRYLDAILERPSFHRFGAISRMAASIRVFLNQRGFQEFVTPVIQPQYGGGTAKPFKTHVNALGCEMYLAISHELYLKRLIVAGYDKVYTIGRYFRNEGIDRSHHPEFGMVETMTAYENYEYNMNLIEDMFRHVATDVFGRLEFMVRGHAIDFGKPWRRISMKDAVKEKTGVDFSACRSVGEANEKLAGLKIYEPQPSIGEALARAFEAAVEPDLIQPTLLHGHPVEISPLAKPMSEDPRFAERFEIFIAGMECGDNWSEQNDAARLLETWRNAWRAGERDAGKFHTLDFDFIEALEYGMPPATGIGPGLERMAMIFTGQENIDDVIFFPMMRPAVSPLNAAIYGVEDPSVAPVEDLVLSFEQFQSLCQEGFIKPHARNLALKPRLRIWNDGAMKGRVRASGHVEIEGIFPNSLLRLAGIGVEPPMPAADGEQRKTLSDQVETSLAQLLRKSFPECQITVSPVTVTRG